MSLASPGSFAATSAVVGAVDLTGRSASIASTNLLASASAGLYHLSYYLWITRVGTAGTVTVTVGWSDGSKTQSLVSSAVSLTSLGAFVQFTQTIKVAATTNITYLTTVSGATGSPLYSLSMRLEKMN